MTYNFTRDQWDHIWDDMYPGIDFVDARIKYWNKHLKPKFNLQYNESMFEKDPDVYGSITGDEKHINWFLLNL
jgi:hypothetical protein